MARNESAAFVFPTQLGWMSVAIRENLICQLRFGHGTPRAAHRALGTAIQVADTTPRAWQDFQQRLEDYAAGEEVDFDEFEIDDRHMTGFQQRVVQQCRQIPYGATLSYGELAARAGSPGAARAVGNIMSNNRVALIIPCHRVVGAQGALGGYSAPDGIRMKKRLLALEGSFQPKALAAV